MTTVKSLSIVRSVKEKDLIIHVYPEPSGVKQAESNIFLFYFVEGCTSSGKACAEVRKSRILWLRKVMSWHLLVIKFFLLVIVETDYKSSRSSVTSSILSRSAKSKCPVQ